MIKQTQAGQKALEELIADLKPQVAQIEQSITTTKGHYGRYMAILARYPKEYRKTLALLLLKAGANYEGLKWALRLS